MSPEMYVYSLLISKTKTTTTPKHVRNRKSKSGEHSKGWPQTETLSLKNGSHSGSGSLLSSKTWLSEPSSHLFSEAAGRTKAVCSMFIHVYAVYGCVSCCDKEKVIQIR